jgi:hypothetical protein
MGHNENYFDRVDACLEKGDIKGACAIITEFPGFCRTAVRLANMMYSDGVPTQADIQRLREALLLPHDWPDQDQEV